MADGPQHLSSAREMQSCGQTFMVTPMTSKPCCLSKWAATLESTPPLMPTRTRLLPDDIRALYVRILREQPCESGSPQPSVPKASPEILQFISLVKALGPGLGAEDACRT